MSHTHPDEPSYLKEHATSHPLPRAIESFILSSFLLEPRSLSESRSFCNGAASGLSWDMCSISLIIPLSPPRLYLCIEDQDKMRFFVYYSSCPPIHLLPRSPSKILVFTNHPPPRQQFPSSRAHLVPRIPNPNPLRHEIAHNPTWPEPKKPTDRRSASNPPAQ
jgi:hypothetical protein